MLAPSPSQGVITVQPPITYQPYDDARGYTDQFNTPLTPQEEAAYQAWGKAEAAKRADGRNPANDTYDYDMRGFWKSGGQFAGNGHAGDAWKKPNHPTFSNLSKYSTTQTPGGQWQQLPDGSWTFTPTQHNLKFNDAGDLQQYFAKQEQGNKLILPQTQQSGGVAPPASPSALPTAMPPAAKPPVAQPLQAPAVVQSAQPQAPANVR